MRFNEDDVSWSKATGVSVTFWLSLWALYQYAPWMADMVRLMSPGLFLLVAVLAGAALALRFGRRRFDALSELGTADEYVTTRFGALKDANDGHHRF